MSGEVTGFEFVEHTADLGVRAWGPSLAAAFEQAAVGMMAYQLEHPEAVGERDFRVLEIQEDSLERLLVRFLDDLNFEALTEGFVYRRVEVDLDAAGSRLTARAHGEFLDPDRHGHLHEIKAITFHDLEIRRAPPQVYVIFDI